LWPNDYGNPIESLRELQRNIVIVPSILVEIPANFGPKTEVYSRTSLLDFSSVM
jgi:hypothetical protein